MIVEDVTANYYASTTEYRDVLLATRVDLGDQTLYPVCSLLEQWDGKTPIYLLEADDADGTAPFCSVRVPQRLVGAVRRNCLFYRNDLLSQITVRVEDRGEDGLWLNQLTSEKSKS